MKKTYEELEAEVERLKRFETAYKEWHDKTEWVQDTAKGKEWGMHRADILKQRIEALAPDAHRYRFVINCPIRTMVALSRLANSDDDFDLSAECDKLMARKVPDGH